MNEICIVEGCDRQRGKRRGYCGTHYNRWTTGKDLATPIESRQPTAGFCSIEGCQRRKERRGYCDAHYARVKSGRDVNAPIREFIDKKSPCCVDGCELPRRVSKWCSAHYQRIRKGRDLTPPVRQPRFDHAPICSVDGCERPHSSHGYCSTHCDRWKRHGSTEPRKTKSALTLAYEAGDFDSLISLVFKKASIDDNGCWVWPKLHNYKYPSTMVAGRKIHRAILEAKLGAQLGTQYAHHMCANTACVNPDHLQPVTNRENIAEMLARNSYEQRIHELEEAIAELEPHHPVLNRVPVGKAS